MTRTVNVVAIETTKHYLFECHRYRQIREEMRNVIVRYCTPSLNCLLFGDEHLNFNTNSVIIIAVQKYIADSKWFNSLENLSRSLSQSAYAKPKTQINCEADQRLRFLYSDSSIPLLLKYVISSF